MKNLTVIFIWTILSGFAIASTFVIGAGTDTAGTSPFSVHQTVNTLSAQPVPSHIEGLPLFKVDATSVIGYRSIGDLNGDGAVDAADYNILRSGLGKCAGDPGYDPDADYDYDGCISFRDYRTWYGYYRSNQ